MTRASLLQRCLIALLLVGCGNPIEAISGALNAGPIALWAGERNTRDSVGGYHGGPSGGVAFVERRPGYAFHLRGGAAEVRVPGHTFPMLTQSTVDFWVNPDVDIDDSLATTKYVWSRGSYTSWIAFEDESGQLEVRLPGGASLRSARSVWPAGEWHRITVSYDGSTHVLYVDGTVEATLATERGLMDNDNDIVIGYNTSPFAFEGAIDEVAVYDHARPPDLPSLSGPVALWKGDGDARDSAGSFHGELLLGAHFWPPGGPPTAFLFDGSPGVMFHKVPVPLQFTLTLRFRPAQDLALVGGSKRLFGRGPPHSIGHDEHGRLEVHVGYVPVLVGSRSDFRRDQWYQVVLTYNGSGYSLYVDGVLDATASGANLLGIGDAFWMGNSAGAIDDVTIYDRVLTAAEINPPADAGAPPTDAADGGSDTSAPPDAGGPALPGLVALWPGDGDPSEVVGSAEGELRGGAGFWPPGGPPSAFLFDGVDDHVFVGQSAPAPERFTLTFGFRPAEHLSATGRTRSFVARGSSTNIGHDEYGRLELHVGWNTVLLGSRIDWRRDEWHQVALTYDGSAYVLYVDGIQEGVGAGASMLANNNDFTIGAPTSGFAGAIDNVAIYDRVLTASEIGVPVDAGADGGLGGPADAGADGHTADAEVDGVGFGGDESTAQERRNLFQPRNQPGRSYE